MSATVNNVNLELIKFKKKITWSFLRGSRFDAYTGGIGSIIQRVMDLAADGKQVNIPLLDQLHGDGVATGQLVGREEALDQYGMPMWADWGRHAVIFNKSGIKESAINIRDAGTPALDKWTKRWRRDDMVDALLSIPTAAIPSNFHADPGNRVNGVRWRDATSTQRNNWQTANADRITFGHAVANAVAGNFASSVLNVGTTSDKMSAAIGRFMQRTASQTTNIASWPAITPYMVEGTDEEWYVCFMGERAFRDLSADPEMIAANKDARHRETGDPLKDNPIFSGAHLVKDGIIYRKIPEIDTRYIIGTSAGSSVATPTGPLAGVGASSVDVSPVFLCGQNAYAYVVGQLPKPTRRDETDYQFVTGMGMEMQYGYGKIAKAPSNSAGGIGTLKDWGVVTGFVASAPDA